MKHKQVALFKKRAESLIKTITKKDWRTQPGVANDLLEIGMRIARLEKNMRPKPKSQLDDKDLFG